MASAGAAAPAAGAGRGLRTVWARVRMRDHDLRMALGLGAFALVLRVAWVLSVRRHGLAVNDALFYDVVAQQLAAGKGFTLANGIPTAGWPPLYPITLSLAFRVFGHGYAVGSLLNALIGAATVPLLYLTTLRTFGRREAVFAAGLLVLFPTQIFLTDVLISETLDAFLVVLVFALMTLLRPTRGAAVLVGLFIGICALARIENVLLIVVPMVVWWPQLSSRQRALRVAILIAMVVVALVPWAIRNSERLHTSLVLSTNGGQTLYAGHNPRASGGVSFAPESLIANDLRLPEPKREVELNDTLTSYAEHWALNHPLQELLLIPKRLVAFIGNDADLFPTWVLPDHTRNPTIGRAGAQRLEFLTSIMWSGLFIAFLAVVALAWAGICRGRQGARGQPIARAALVLIGATTALYCIVFFGGWRYHVALEPLMMLLIAPASTAAWSARSQLSARFRGPSADAPPGV